MKIRFFILTTLLFASLMAGSLITVDVPSPGATGMATQPDIDALRITDSRYSENVDVATRAGRIIPRKAVTFVDTTILRLKVAEGIFTRLYGRKQVVGFKPLAASTQIGRTINNTAVTVPTANLLGSIQYSDTFTYAPKYMVVNDSIPTRSSIGGFSYNYDIMHYEDMLIFSNGKSAPLCYTPYSDKVNSQYEQFWNPQVHDFGLLAPGQPRATVVPKWGTQALNGVYEYCIAFAKNDDTFDFGDTSRHSIIVAPKNEWVIISNFIIRAADTNALVCVFRHDITDQTTNIPLTPYLGLGYSDTLWTLIDTIFVGRANYHTKMVIDSGQTTIGGSTYLLSVIDSIPAPGQIVLHSTITDGDTICDTGWANANKSCWMKYSFYDPTTGLESPLGIGLYGQVTDSTPDSSFGTCLHFAFSPRFYWLPYSDTIKSQARFIRLYRSSQDDSIKYYCVGQYPVTGIWYDTGKVVAFGYFSDDVFENYDNPWEWVRNEAFGGVRPYLWKYEAYDEDGELIIRPPYVGPNTIPFSDMEYASGRLWGIGDPLYPQRLYYSGYEDINDWTAMAYFSMDENENDELVAIEKVEGTGSDIIYAFKHNSVYIVTGYDPEYDLTIERLTAEAGALNKQSVIKMNNSIYFMSTEHRIYELSANKFQYISYPVQSWIDSVFTDVRDDSVHTYCLADKVNFMQSATSVKKAVSYNLLSNTWSIESYNANFVPIGSFLYDTSQNQTGFNQYSYLMYENDAAYSHLYTEHTGRVDSTYFQNDSTTKQKNDTISFTVQPYFVGDGENIWQIQYVQFSCLGDSGKNIIGTIYDGDGNSVTAGWTKMNKNTYADYTMTFPEHADKYLSLRLSGKMSSLNNVKIVARKIGRAETFY